MTRVRPARSTPPPRSQTGALRALGVVSLLVLGLAGCAANPQVEFARPTRAATLTVTVTTTVNGIGMATSPTTTEPTTTEPTTPAPTATSTVSPVLGPAPVLTPVPAATFDRALADPTFRSIVAGITVIDGQLATGASPSLRLDVLATDLGTLVVLGVPPGLDGPSYFSRVRSLETFAAATADESLTDPARARERYQVVRRETGALLAQVNEAIGTTYALPPAAAGANSG